jgi:hypothetical protein
MTRYTLTLTNETGREAAEADIVDGGFGKITIDIDGNGAELAGPRIQDAMRDALTELAEELGVPWGDW